MSMNKQSLIAQYLAKPLEKGDNIWVPEPSTRNPNKIELRVVDRIVGNTVYYKSDSDGTSKIDISKIEKDTRHIGADHFKEPFKARQYNIDIWQLLFRTGWVESSGTWVPRCEKVGEFTVPEVNYDSCVNVDGKDVVYQRGLVWSIEDKQLLIESIYNNIEIGKFVIRTRSWGWVEKRLKEGKCKYTAFADVVDGKQRLNALLDFVTNKFSDSHGSYWDDLSTAAQYKFKKCMKFSYFEIDDEVADKEILEQFLAINFTGAPMSVEHIKYVQTLYKDIGQTPTN